MGAFRFEREPRVPNSNKNVIEFDSSADRAIGRLLGLDEETCRLEETSRTDRQVNYDVYMAEFTPEGAEPRPQVRRGILMCLSRDECWKRQTGDNFYGRKFT